MPSALPAVFSRSTLFAMPANENPVSAPVSAPRRPIAIGGRSNLTQEELSEIATVSALPWTKAKPMLQLPETVTGLAILDIGGGASDSTATLLQMGADAFAIDPHYKKKSVISERIKAQLKHGKYDVQTRMQINQALQKFLASSEAAPERYKAASATQIPFPDHSFDIVFSIDTVTAFFDMDREMLMKCFKECLRVAKPGALLTFLPFQDLQLSWTPQINGLRLSNDRVLLDWLQKHPDIASVEITNTSTQFHHRLTVKKK